MTIIFRKTRWILLLGLKVAESLGMGEQMEQMMNQMVYGDGFIAALDQSGGSTPKALDLYDYPKDMYEIGETSMFDAVHEMRTRIITSPAFTGDRILGAILFEDTMKREIKSHPVPEYLWRWKGIVPFLKVDRGLMEKEKGVQLMKPIPDLDDMLQDCQTRGIFGTKMRSLIHDDNVEGITAVVKQQFEIGRQIIAAGLTPIIEPEVSITSRVKQECEELLKAELLNYLDCLGEGENVMLKLTIPSKPNFYEECIKHPRCLRVVALSGGYSRAEALYLLDMQPKMIASFSRALTEGLNYELSDEEFDVVLDGTIAQICESSKA